jgi:hypothetical protein
MGTDPTPFLVKPGGGKPHMSLGGGRYC